MKNSFLSVSMIAITAIVFCNDIFSQSSTLSPELIKNISKSQIGKNLKEQKEFLRKYSKQIKYDTTNIDSLNRIDSSSFQHQTDFDGTNDKQQISVYEAILSAKIMNPDSMLSNLEIFGHSLFKRKKADQSTPKQIAVPADYPVESGDEIMITMWGRINEEIRLPIDRDGIINIPRVGPISVGGLPFKLMQKNIITKLQNIEGVQASVSMSSLSDIRIFVVGEVPQPGQYNVGALTNVTNILFSADGFTKSGSMRNVQLVRNGKTINQFDFYDFLISGNNFSNVRLKTDDVIVVPVIKKMAVIVGNVRRSALYELNNKTQLKEMIELSGGFTPNAWINKIQIERYLANKHQVIMDLEITSIDKLPDFEIQDGDIIKIFPVVMLDKNAVYLNGNVRRPGKYQYIEKMRVSDIISSYELLMPETYLNYAIIHRQEPPTNAERILSFNLENVLKNPQSSDNLLLMPLDKITVYNQNFYEPDRIVSISGAITKSGTYKMLTNMHIKDLILEAGGLTEQASTERGELYHRIVDKDSIRTEKINFHVTLAMQNDSLHNYLLSKNDYVVIRKKRGWEDQKSLTFKGEFIFPGTYIVLENEKLGDVIRRAGGFKSEAFLKAAIYTRVSVKELEKKRIEDYTIQLESDIIRIVNDMASRGSNVSDMQAIISQQQNQLNKLKKVIPYGRIVVDFENSNSYLSMEIEDGDTLFIPRLHNTISVIGEVYNPSTFVLDKKNKLASTFIELAGGYNEDANKKNVYVIKANGSVRTKNMVNMNRYELEPGDAIVIPRKITTLSGFNRFVNAVAPVSTIVMNSLVLTQNLLSIQQILKK